MLGSQRLQELQTGIFLVLDKEKKKIEKEGIEVINLGIGSPDLPPALEVREALKGAVDDGKQYGYAMTGGSTEFKEAVVNWYNKRFNVSLDSEKEVLSLIGSQDGLSHISHAFLDFGDIGLIPDPGYPVYKASVTLAGGISYPLKLNSENNYLPDLDKIPSEICEMARILFLNYPSNPLAATASREFFEKVVKFARDNNIVVCHDAAYSELAYDGYQPISFLQVEGAKEVGVEFHSLSKTFNMAGCRLGFVVGNQEVIAALTAIKSNIDYGVFKPIQKAGVAALNMDEEWIEKLRSIYTKRRNILVDGLNSIGWEMEKPKASMFVWAKIPHSFSSSEQFALQLLQKTGVLVVPGTAFGEQGEGYVRIALVANEEKMQQAVERCKKFFKEIS
jgi:LL-diaminopimelate aminotransferase